MNKANNKVISMSPEQAQYFLHDVMDYLTLVNSSYDFLEKMVNGKIDTKNKDTFIRIGRKGINELNNLCTMYRLIFLNRYSLNMEKILVRENLATPLEVLNFSYNLNKLSLSNEVSKDFELEVDKTLFCQCLLNIFKNAIEHQLQTKQDHILISMWNGAKSLYISNPYIVDGSIVEKRSPNIGMKFVTQALEAMGLGFQKSVVNGNFLLTISAS